MASLARVMNLPPKAVIDPAKATVDMDTVRAVITIRFHVMAHNARDVMLPVWVAEYHRAQDATATWMKRARRPLVRNEALMPERDRHVLTQVCESSYEVHVGYWYKQRLTLICEDAGTIQVSLLHALQTWCN